MPNTQNDERVLDTTKLITGKDGTMFIANASGVFVPMLAVDTFQVQLNFSNTDYQPVGSYMSFGVPVNFTVSLTFTEAVVDDTLVLTRILDGLKKDTAGYKTAVLAFQGKMNRRDGQSEVMNFENCIPDGSFDLMNLTPGDIIKRQNSFRVNKCPQLEGNKYFKYVA